MQFIITAYDGTDEGALDRRMQVRPRHLESMKKLCAEGRVVSAGGILSDEGMMKGSFLVMNFEDRAAVDAYLASEPYVTEKVWQEIKVERANAVIVNNEMVGK